MPIPIRWAFGERGKCSVSLTHEPLKCKVNSTLASPNRVHGDRIQFWTTDDPHGETPFDDAEPGEGGVPDEDTQGFGLIQIELL